MLFAGSALAQTLGSTSDTATAPTYSWFGDTGTGVWRPAASSIGFATGSSERVRIDSTGNVGIGVTNPQVKLEVVGAVRSVPGAGGAMTTFDWSLTNNHTTTTGCGTTYTMNNMQDGAVYTILVRNNTHSGACAFTGSGVSSWKLRPAAVTPSAGHVVISVVKSGTDAYVTWTDAY